MARYRRKKSRRRYRGRKRSNRPTMRKSRYHARVGRRM